MILIYTTCKDQEEAKAIGAAIVEKRWAASIHFWHIDAMYRSDNGVGEGQGTAVMIQTLEKHLQNIEDLITEHRPHATPFIGTLAVTRVNRAYKERASDMMR